MGKVSSENYSEDHRKIPSVVLVLGPPAVGKSTLSKRLANDLNAMILSKDEIKETLFDSLGISDRDWSRKLGGASFDLLFKMIEKNLRHQNSLVIDSDFSSIEKHSARFQEIFAGHTLQIIQLNLLCNGELLFERFKRRAESGQRHPGHCDHENYDEFRNMLLGGKRSFLHLPSKNLEIDTTKFDDVNYEEILKFVIESAS